MVLNGASAPRNYLFLVLDPAAEGKKKKTQHTDFCDSYHSMV